MTKGYARARREYYTHHDNPKQLYVRILHPNALKLLCADQTAEEWCDGELKRKVRCRTKAGELGSIRTIFEGFDDYRTGSNWCYTLSGLLTLAFCATLAGMSLGQRDIAEYAEDLSQGQLRALGFRRNRKTARFLGARAVEEKSNEIPAARELIEVCRRRSYASDRCATYP